MRKQTKIWKCQDGRRVRVCDMSDSHLNNTIKMLEKCAKHELCNAIVGTGYALMVVNGDMAEMSLDSQLSYLTEQEPWEDFLPDIYDNLLDDAGRRGI